VTSVDRVAVAKRYLRRKYADDVEGLKALAESVAVGAFTSVTITGNGYEGGSATGQITFEPLEYLAAVEGVIAELDEDAPQDGASTVLSDFSQRPVMT
jgi:hypothetical protein